MTRVIKAPQSFHLLEPHKTTVFLAGTIDNGDSVDWQTIATEYILNNTNFNVINPRREEWDSSWEQSISNPQFKEQVEWELDGLDYSEVILMHFEQGSLSPISLLELGLHAQSGKLVVSCPQEFWRVGNVEVVCARYDVPLFRTLSEALHHIC